MMQVPSAYVKGYAKAKAVDPVTADKYIKHTTIGDPELDPVMEEISSLPPGDLHRFTKAGIEQEEEVLRTAPQVLRDFFDKTDRDTPPWLDYNEFEPGQRAFYANLNNMLIAYAIGSAVEGFSTLVSKSFSITGRVTGGGAGAERRLRQNNRHMVEVYYPGGMQRDGDGWKVSMRIRFIHARVRKLLADSSLWDYEAWGVPLSAAHTGGISLFTFSIRQFEHACAMGSKVSTEQKESIIKIWRYAGYLLGVPESILFANEEEARKIYKIGHMCEPPPDSDAKNLANMVFKVLPTMAGLTDEAKKKSLEMYAYRLSRALIGNKLADQFQYPRTFRIRPLVLAYYRIKNHLPNLMKNIGSQQEDAFSQIFDATQYDKGGISYKMPDHVRASKSNLW